MGCKVLRLKERNLLKFFFRNFKKKVKTYHGNKSFKSSWFITDTNMIITVSLVITIKI